MEADPLIGSAAPEPTNGRRIASRGILLGSAVALAYACVSVTTGASGVSGDAAAPAASGVPVAALQQADTSIAAMNHIQPGILHAFGKWTFCSASEEYAEQNVEAMWQGMNQVILERNESTEPKFQEVGPTGCAVTKRKWTALRYLVGDNNIHWVHDEASTNPLNGNITVKAMHDYVRALHGDLTEINQFSDFRITMVAYEIEPYVVGAKELKATFGWPYRLIKARTNVPGRDAYIVRTVTQDGQLIETAALHGPTDNTEEFELDECLYYPMTHFNRSKDDCLSYIADDYAAGNTHVPEGCQFWDFTMEQIGYAKLGDYINVRKMPRDSTLPVSIPTHTHLASSDPTRDANFFLNYFGVEAFMTHLSTGGVTVTEAEALRQGAARDVTHEERAALEGNDAGSCGTYESRWLRMDTTDGANYLHFAYHPDAPHGELNGVEMPLKKWELYLAHIRKNMNHNTYDRFMDDHIGIDLSGGGPTFYAIAAELYKAHQPMLTRREPTPAAPSAFWTDGSEKFSVFFKFPVSHYIVQLSIVGFNQDYLSSYGMPNMCDWDFCPEWFNWRVKDEYTTAGKMLDPLICGFSSNTVNFTYTDNFIPAPAPRTGDDDGSGR